DQRLTPLGVETGLVGAQRAELFAAKSAELSRGRVLLHQLKASPSAAGQADIAVNADGKARSAFDLLSYPDVSVADATRLWPELPSIPEPILGQLVVDAQYAVYLDRQARDI